MCASRRQLFAWLVLVGVWVVAAPALAWTETTVKSDVATIDLERDGTAIVSHEIVVKVRGAPLTGFELDGVSDAEPLSDATVSQAASGASGSTATPLLLSKGDDGVLRIEVDDKKQGLSQGTFLFKLRYRTNLLADNKIEQRGAWVEVRWVGPRFADGIDSARVVFRVPQTETPPQLPDFAAERPAAAEELDDTFLSNLRRAPDKDELEVVRPHVAKGDPVLWRVLASPRAFDAFSSKRAERGPLPVDAVETRAWMPSRPWIAGALALLAAVYGGLVLLKWRFLVRGCEQTKAKARALIPLPPVPRAALSGFTLAASVAVALCTELPTLAGAVFVTAMALAAHVGPSVQVSLRGPGRWLALREDEAFARRPRALPGQWLDGGALKGFVVLVALVGAFVVAAARLLPTTPYHAVLLALGSACLLPIFCTGRSSELPLDPATAPRKFLTWLAERLRKNEELKVVPWARVPEGGAEPDELRLLVVPRRARPGLLGLEVGLEYHQGGGGPVSLPFVIVRARDGSPCYEALPRDIVWMRGRKPEERVAVIRPKLPTWAMCLSLLERVIERLELPEPSVQRPTRAESSRGRGASTENAGSRVAPFQAR
jgi:hypothetical protein